jgi:hypothetical protein
METPKQTALRLLSALEDLVSRESTLLRNMSFDDAVTIQERSGPLVHELARLAAYPDVASLKPRVAALIERRVESWRVLDGHLAHMQVKLGQIHSARSRLARIGPVYGARRAAADGRLNAAA